MTTRDEFCANQEALAVKSYAQHQIFKAEEGRWVIREVSSSVFWTDIICTHGLGLYVDGDIEPVIFRYGPEDFRSRVQWMGSRQHAWDVYFREKASIGTGGRGAIEEWVAEIALSDFRDWLLDSDCADREIDDVVEVLEGNECTRDDFLRTAQTLNVEMETFYEMGTVPSSRMFFAHAALQRLSVLLDETKEES